ncbi:MAG TPA: ABC transporter permease [Novosphingobium sp.]|nr:ABC transporter permease [Novosphingobium sp.]
MTGWLARRYPRAAAIRAKEWAQIRRDPSSFGLVVMLPLMLMFLFGNALSLDTSRTRAAIVDLDRTAASRELVAVFAHSGHFAMVEAPSQAAVARDLTEERIRAFIVIPDGFEAGLETRTPRDIQVNTDGSQPNTAAFAAGHARGILGEWLQARARERGMALAPLLALQPRYIYNPGLLSRYMLVPGAIVMVMAMIGTLLTALVMAREYERGTMEGLLATPLSVPSLVLNKLLPYFALGMASTLLCVAVAVIGYGLPFRGSVVALLAISASFLAASLGMGLMISALTKNQFVASQMAMLAGFLPTMLLSGFLFEIDSMPRAIQWLTWLVPARYLVTPLQTVFLAGDVWSLFLPGIAALLGFTALFFLVVTRTITRRIA